MNKTVGMLLMALAIASNSSFAHVTKLNLKSGDKILCDGIAPRNNLHISEFDKTGGGIDKATFDRIIAKVEQYYVPIAAQLGAKLTFNRLWSESDIARDTEGAVIKDPSTASL